MQRLGRINRIGSESGTIYSYNFYPSEEGDDLIKLYEKSLVKLQGFHTAFGEDSKIFTHEELVEQFELFQEGMTDDEDKRLLYLRFIREFKDQNPGEFKRIQNFPMKARTGRKFNKAVLGKDETTLVFLKSTYKTDFFEVRDKEIKPLTFIEAAERFEAKPSENGVPIPDIHFDHVQKSIQEFERDYLGSTSESVSTGDKADAISKQASKFLRETRGLTTNQQTKKACTALEELVDKGTYTPLPNEIRKMKRQLDKRQITYGQVDNLLIGLAKSYDAFEEEEAERIEHDGHITPEIVITETFSE